MDERSKEALTTIGIIGAVTVAGAAGAYAIYTDGMEKGAEEARTDIARDAIAAREIAYQQDTGHRLEPRSYRVTDNMESAATESLQVLDAKEGFAARVQYKDGSVIYYHSTYGATYLSAGVQKLFEQAGGLKNGVPVREPNETLGAITTDRFNIIFRPNGFVREPRPDLKADSRALPALPSHEKVMI